MSDGGIGSGGTRRAVGRDAPFRGAGPEGPSSPTYKRRITSQ
jgi:hypothetical protein